MPTLTIDALVLSIPCAYCRADPGQQCVTRSGNRATEPHDARLGPVLFAWLKGVDSVTVAASRD